MVFYGVIWRYFSDLEVHLFLAQTQSMETLKEKLSDLALESQTREKNEFNEKEPRPNGLSKTNGISKNKFKRSKKLKNYPLFDFSLPIYIQRRRDFGLTISSPDMNITHFLPQAGKYESFQEFCADLNVTLAEVDRLAVEEFKRRDETTNKKHREKLFPRGLKDHLEIDIHKLTFKPPQAAELTTKSLRTWQRWCKNRRVKRRSNGLKFKRRHYQIPFSEIEPHLKQEFVENPKLILSYVTL